MIIAGLFCGYHDAAACIFDDYRLVASVALERMTRIKSDGQRLPLEALDECLAIAGLGRRDIDAVALERAFYPARYFRCQPLGRRIESAFRGLTGSTKNRKVMGEMERLGRQPAEDIFDSGRFLADLGMRPDIPLRFFNHHYAHALPTLFHTDWDDALLYTADGGGDNVQYSHRLFRDGGLETYFGADDDSFRPVRIDSIGRAYGFVTRALGFRINRHEGKVTGLAAFGEPTLYDEIRGRFRVDDAGQVHTDFRSYGEMDAWISDLARSVPREEAAASIQKTLEDVLLDAVGRLIERTGTRKLGLAGGVFANVRLNQRLAEELPVDEVFVYPAMSDQGLACGGALQFLLERDGMEAWLGNRYRLDHLYYGRDYSGEIDKVLSRQFEIVSDAPAATTAELLEAGAAIGIYTRGMEYGPRALGARSILASATDASINGRLNERLERTEFMPFAPVVAVEDADTLFELGGPKAYAARFMTITCGVRAEWAPRIPAVVHVDGTARPQVISRAPNPLYYDILQAYKTRTGIPALINTSFNAHEEPIIDTPEQCARALADDRVDYVVTDGGVYAGPSAARNRNL